MARSPGVVTVLIPLPLTYNPDAAGRRRPIEETKFSETMSEIAKRFGGGVLWRFRNDPPDGFWWNKGYLYKDILAVIEVDIPNTAKARAWLKRYARNVLVQRFKQEAIYLKVVGPVETTEVIAVRKR